MVQPAIYQTYANRLHKRQRSSSTSAGGDDAASRAPLKKSQRPKPDDYNHEYMAGICFSAHETRRYELSFDKYDKDVADDLRENLVIMFKHAQSKGFFKNSTAARQMIPRLASIRPRDNKEKVQFVQEFIKHYDSARSDMAEIEGLMARGSQIDADFIDTTREHLIALYHNLRQGEKWRIVLPYTPLPKKSVLKLRDLIKCNGKFFLLGDLVHHIDEIEDWLSLPPPPRDHFTGVMEEYMRVNAVPKPNIGAQRQPTAEEAAQQKEAARVKAQREKADREAAQLKLAAQQRAQEAVKRKKEADDALECEKKVRDENTRQAKRIQELEAQKAKDAAELAKLRKAKAARQQEQVQHEDPITKERAELQKKSEELRGALEALSALESNGQVTPAALQELSAPSKQNCLPRLRVLWEKLQHDIATVEPRDLLRSSDFLLRFDFDLLDAHCLMKVLTCRGCGDLEPQSTGWDFAAMVKLQSRLLPHAAAANRTLFGVISNVNGIATILMEGLQRERACEQLEASKRMNRSMGSSTGTTLTGQSSIFTPQSSLGTSFGASAGGNSSSASNPFQKAPNTFSPQGPLLEAPLDTAMIDSGSSGLPSHGQNGNLFGSQSSNNSASRPQQGSSGRFVEACRAYKKGECRKGVNCKHPHNPCKHWMRNQCTYGDKCKRSHDPFSKENNKIEPMILDPVQTPHQPFAQANPFRGGPPAIPTGPRIPQNQSFTQANPFGNGSSAIPTGPKNPLAARMTKNGRPVSPNVPNHAFGSYNANSSNVFSRAPTSAPTGPRVPPTDRMSIDIEPPFPPQTQTSGFQGASTSAGQGPPQAKQQSSKKDACKSFLKGRCNKSDEECRYAHKACPFFLLGKCKFGDKCNKGSHDEAFRTQGTSNGSAQHPAKPQHPFQAPQGPLFGQQQQQQQKSELNADTAEKYLADIMKAKPSKGQPPNSNSTGARQVPRTEQAFNIERWKQRPQEQPTLNANTAENFLNAIVKAKRAKRAKLQSNMNKPGAMRAQTQQPFQGRPQVPTGQQRQQQSSLNAATAENYLDAIVKAAPKPKSQHHNNNNNTQPATISGPPKPKSEIPCLFQKKNAMGCTNRACPFKHDPPKTTAEGRGGVRSVLEKLTGAFRFNARGQ